MELFSLFGTLGMKGVKDAERDIDSVEGKAQGAAGKIGTVFKAGAAIATTAIVALGTASTAAVIKSVKAAGELEQQLGGADAVFGKYADVIKKKGVEAYDKLGLSQSDYLATANKMGALFQGSGFTQQKSLDLTSKAMQRASDVASIMGIDIKDAMESVTGAAKGNYTMMDNLGVGMNDTTLEAYAMSKGIDKSWKSMSQAEKVGVAMEMFLDKTSYAAGNYSKENATLAGSLDTAKAALGNFMSGAGSIDQVISSGMNFAAIAGKSAMQMAPKILGGLASGIKQILPKVPSIMKSLGDGIRDGLGAILEATLGKEIADKATKAFDQIRQVGTTVFNNLSNIFNAVSTVIGSVINIIGKLWEGFNGGEASKQVLNNLGDTLQFLSDKLVDGVNAVGKFLNKLAESGKVQEFGKFLKDVVKTLQDFAPIIVAVIAGFAGFMAVWKFFDLMAKGFVLINNLKNAFIAAKGVVIGFNAVLAANPIGIIVGLIAALVAGLVYFFTQTTAGKQIWQDFMTWIKNAWQDISLFFTQLWSSIVQIFNSTVTAIHDFVVPIFNTIASGIQIAMNLIWSVIQIAWQLIKVTIEFVVGGIIAYIQFGFNTWVSIIQFAMNIIKSVITAVWNFIGPFIMGVVNGIKNAISVAWNAISSIISSVMNAIKAFIVPIWNSIKAAISSVMNAIKSVISSIWNSIKSVVSAAVNAIKNTVTSIFNAVKGTVTSIWNGIKNAISSAVNGAKNIVHSVFNSIKGTITSVINSIKSTVTNVFNAIKSAMTKPIEGAKDVISGIVNKIKGLFNFKLKFPKIDIPHIPLPHFSMSGSFNPLKGKIPKIGVDWYAKGGILNSATIFGMNGDNLQVGGEAGREAVLPLNKDTLGGIGRGISETMQSDQQAILDKLDELIEILSLLGFDFDIRLDDGTLVGKLADKIDRAIYDNSRRKQRGRTT